jgi:hypothetical protein
VKHGHERGISAPAEGFNDGCEVRIEPAVAVHHEELTAQLAESRAQRSAGSQQLRSVDFVGDGNVKAAAVPDISLNLLCPIAGADHDTRHAFAAQQPELVHDEGLTGDFQQRLRHLFGQSAEACRQAAGKQRKRGHLGHRMPSALHNRFRSLEIEAKAHFL